MAKRLMAFIAVFVVAGAFATDMDHKGRVIATVGTANAGTAEVTCNNPGDWKFDVKATQDNGRDVVTVRISSSAALLEKADFMASLLTFLLMEKPYSRGLGPCAIPP